jgi:23S rRNA pseudouridine955/2504/2580 synthase
VKEYIIPKAEDGQKVMRFLNRILPNCSNGFLYKMFRKKNITINGKKVTGKEVLRQDDVVKIFFSDETFEKFSGKSVEVSNPYEGIDVSKLEICYEDEDIIVCNKPANVLSQKSKASDVSINEILIAYMLNSGEITLDSLEIFKPGVINRLDRNTSGLILFGKTIRGLKFGSELMKSHDTDKTYLCLVSGRYDGPNELDGYLTKDSKNNLVRYSTKETPDSKYMSESISVVEYRENFTLLKVVLHTGRSHQIRCSLAAIGFPILGDVKYGNQELNQKYLKKGVDRALLHSSSIRLNGRVVECETPDIFSKVK